MYHVSHEEICSNMNTSFSANMNLKPLSQVDNNFAAHTKVPTPNWDCALSFVQFLFLTEIVISTTTHENADELRKCLAGRDFARALRRVFVVKTYSTLCCCITTLDL